MQKSGVGNQEGGAKKRLWVIKEWALQLRHLGWLHMNTQETYSKI